MIVGSITLVRLLITLIRFIICKRFSLYRPSMRTCIFMCVCVCVCVCVLKPTIIYIHFHVEEAFFEYKSTRSIVCCIKSMQAPYFMGSFTILYFLCRNIPKIQTNYVISHMVFKMKNLNTIHLYNG